MNATLAGLRNPICVALDSPDPEASFDLTRLAPEVGVLKIGLTTFTAMGPPIVRRLAPLAPVFLDLKLHDIPAQVQGAVHSATEGAASFLTVHASGGRDMMAAAVDAAGEALVLLAVTILTSLDDAALGDIGLEGSSDKAVLRLAELALSSGIPGLVCSPLEVEAIRERFGPRSSGGPLLVVPGIRPPGSDRGDQARTLGPREAIDLGADIIVVGRPITAAADPVAAIRSMAATLVRG